MSAWRFILGSRRRRALAGAGLLLCTLATGALGALLLTRARPAWWRTLDADDAATLRAGEEVENAVVSQLSAVRGGDGEGAAAERASPAWSVSLSDADANAWLATRLPKWLANRSPGFKWPPQVGEVRVSFGEGRVRVGVRLLTGGGEQVLSAEVEPEVREDGSLWLPATGVRVGRLPLPAGWMLDRAQDPGGGSLPRNVLAMPEVSGLLAVLRGERAAAAEPVVGVDDGRRVRLTGLRAREGRLEITARTEAR